MWIDHRQAQEFADHSERERTTVKASATHGFASEPNFQRLRGERVGRRVVLSVLALFVLAGAAGLLGVRSRTVSASANGYDLSVTYATMTRSGLSTPWSFSVHRDGGFEGPVTVATTLDYFELFDENGLDPDPSAATVSGELLVWTFDPPEGETYPSLSTRAWALRSKAESTPPRLSLIDRFQSSKFPTTRGSCPSGNRLSSGRDLLLLVHHDARAGKERAFGALPL